MTWWVLKIQTIFWGVNMKFKFPDKYGDEIENDTFEDYEGFDYDAFMFELDME